MQNVASLQRQLSNYGFKRILDGEFTDYRTHDNFEIGNVVKARTMKPKRSIKKPKQSLSRSYDSSDKENVDNNAHFLPIDAFYGLVSPADFEFITPEGTQDSTSITDSNPSDIFAQTEQDSGFSGTTETASSFQTPANSNLRGDFLDETYDSLARELGLYANK